MAWTSVVCLRIDALIKKTVKARCCCKAHFLIIDESFSCKELSLLPHNNALNLYSLCHWAKRVANLSLNLFWDNPGHHFVNAANHIGTWANFHQDSLTICSWNFKYALNFISWVLSFDTVYPRIQNYIPGPAVSLPRYGERTCGRVTKTKGN